MPSDLSDALRSLRTTLLVGGLWLAAAWLVFGAALIRLGARSDLAAILHPLSRAFGSVGLGAALSTAAFLMGAISLQVFRAPAVWLTNVACLGVIWAERTVVWLVCWYTTRAPLRRYEQWRPLSVDLARRLVADHETEIRRLAGIYGDRSEACHLSTAYLVADRCIARALREGSAEDSYLKLLHERASAQLGLVAPLAAFFLALGWRISPFLYPLAVAGGVVGFAAVDYRRDLEAEIESVIWPQVARVIVIK